MPPRRTTVRRSVAASAATAVVALTGMTGVVTATGAAGATATGSAAGRSAGRTASATPGHAGFVDTRQPATARQRAAQLKQAARVSARPQARSLRRSLGPQLLLDIDPTTGTVRMLTRLDGYLTGPSSRSAVVVASKYVSQNYDALGLTGEDVTSLHLRRDYVDITGTHHLFWTQRVGGHEVFGNGLTASVTRTGRLLTIGGSPITGATAGSRSTTALPTGATAIRAARRAIHERSATPGARDTASQVSFVTSQGTHLAWETITMSGQHPAVSVLDARTGALLYRRPLSADANPTAASSTPSTTPPDSGGKAFDYFPKAPRGGTPHDVDYTAKGWLPATATTLSGNNSHAYSDVNDDDTAQGSEEVHPSSGHRWDYLLKPFHLPRVSFCDHPYPCSWDPRTPYSWRTNRAQNTNQVFYFVNAWHDHLQSAPIGFTEAAGNFQVQNATTKGKGGDAVDTETEDGANTDHGLPDDGHIDNANMDTPPDGQAPIMQMYLQHEPGTSYPDGDPFAPTDVGDEADTVYHEYTHGLSNRLIVDPGGTSTLGGVQAGAMGEAWSDWYAMDDLVASGLQTDAPGKVDVVLFQYDGEGVYLDRTEPIDCKVGSGSSRCTGGETGHGGGYTYADYGTVYDGPEVHSDGEIWGQTLWDLRDALGSRLTESLVTRAMELSPSNPSFLDERNAILVADTEVRDGGDQAAIWRVFAKRGMGFYAGSFGGDDAQPTADFHVPPASSQTAYITGRVTDTDTGQPLAGVPVTLSFQGSGVVNPTATSGADGRYRLGPVPVGHYGKLQIHGGGFESVSTTVTVTASGAIKNFSVRRDWAAASGGASIADFTGPDYSPDCGPGDAIDQSQATGWGSTVGDDDGDPTATFVPKRLVIELPAAVDISSLAIDPGSTCGDDDTASMARYTVETSPNGSTWATAASGTFGPADDGRLNRVTTTAGASAVRYVRLTMRSNQATLSQCPDSGDSGCFYADMSEIEVYGSAH